MILLVIAIMTFLAGFTIAVVSVDRAADARASDIGREVTIEVRPLDVAAEPKVEGGGAGPSSPASAAPTSAMPRRSACWAMAGAGRRPLHPAGAPRLVVVSIDDAAAFDVEALAAAVDGEIRGGSVDDRAVGRPSVGHGRLHGVGRHRPDGADAGGAGYTPWCSRRAPPRRASTSSRCCISVAPRTGFIASQFQRRFLLFGIEGGAIGGALALVAMAAAARAIGGSAGRPGADQLEALFGRFELPTSAYGTVLGLRWRRWRC